MTQATPSSRAVETRPTRGDLLCMAVLIVACLVLRLPSLDRIALNPDESQYEASAYYLAATGSSAFAFPYGVPWTMSLYKLITVVFGPYPMFEVRFLVQLICLAMALILYDMVQRESDRGSGLLSGLVFLHYNISFEGLTANREWFSGFPALLGIYLFSLSGRLSPRRQWWLLAAAGLSCGASIWFKRQAVFLVLVVPITMLWQAWQKRELRALPRRLAPYLLGGAVAAIVFLLPFVVHGSAQAYVASLYADWSSFVNENAAMTQQMAGGSLALYLQRLYLSVPFRAILLVAYAFTLLCLIGGAARLAGRGGSWPGADRPGLLLFAVYLVAALLCVQLGNRFFGHYYLFLMPPVAAMFGLAGHTVGNARGPGFTRWLSAILIGLLVLDRGSALAASLPAIRAVWPASLPMTLYFAAVVGLLGFWMLRPMQRGGSALRMLLLLEAGLMIFLTLLIPTPRSLPHHPDGFRQLAARIETLRAPGDRLFVWGWLPEIYSLTRLEPASHMTITEYVVGDYYIATKGPTIDRPTARLMLQDLEARKPRFLVDGADRSWTMVADRDPWLYDLSQYPDFELVRLLDTEYVRDGRYDGCELYVRRTAGP